MPDKRRERLLFLDVEGEGGKEGRADGEKGTFGRKNFLKTLFLFLVWVGEGVGGVGVEGL